MNSFINNLVSRHVETGNQIKPRLRGKFEPPVMGENALSPDFNNDTSSTNNTTGPQTIKPVSEPPFSINEQDNDNSDKLNIDYPLRRQEQKHSDQLSADRRDMNAGNESSTQPLVTSTGRQDTQLKSDKSNDTIFIPEINRVLTNPGTAEIISGDNSNHTVGDSFKNEADTAHLNSSDIQTIRTSTDNHRLQSKLTGQVLPADLKWLKTIKQDLNTRNGVQNNQSSTPPVIKVTIGKIEVRAVNQSAPVQTRETPKPRMTLDDFLKQRNGGKS